MIERKIIIALIISTEYCSKIKEIWDSNLLESATAKRIASWIWEYYDKYQKAPGKEIETIYYTKLKDNKLPKDIAEEIEQDILPSLSDEYASEEFNLVYLTDQTEKHFEAQKLKILSDNVQSLVTAGELTQAIQVVKDFKPIDTVTNSLDDFVTSADEIRQKNVTRPALLLHPWLREGQTTIIYGNYGAGKSLLTLNIAYLLGLEEYKRDECEIGEWFVKRPTGCLYIDGEIGEQEMEERIKSFEWLGKQHATRKVKILSIPEYQLATEDSFSLGERKNQLKIIKWLDKNPRYKLIVLDSVSTLFGLIEENDNSEWNNKINPFMRDLRALGVACILLHHAGKDNKRGLRGASAMGAMAHNIFRLTNSGDKNPDRGEAWFNLTKDKQRSAGKSFKEFGLHYYKDGDETHWEITKIKVE